MMAARYTRWQFAACLFLVQLVFAVPVARGAPGDILFSDDFERAALGPDWTVSGTGDAAIGTQTANSGTRSLYTRWDTVDVTSRVIDMSAVPAARLSAWIRRGDDTFSELPDNNEDLFVDYYSSAGSWTPLGNFPGGGTPGEIFTPTFILPVDALHAGFRLRIRQGTGSGSDFDYWHVDDVQLVEAATMAGGFCDDFESGLGNWQAFASGGDAGIGTHTASSPGNSLYLRWGAVSVVSVVSDLSAVTGGSIRYWVRRGDDSFSEDPDNNEDLVVEYYSSAGAWQVLDTLAGSGTNGQQYIRNFALPADARHAQFQLRFRLLSGSGPDFDYWHVDDVCVGTASFTPATPMAYYAMDETSWSGTPGEVIDSGGTNHGVAVGAAQTIDPVPATPPSTCRAGDIPDNTLNTAFDAVDTGLDVDSAIGNAGSISFWYKGNTAWNDGLSRTLFDASSDLGNNGADKFFFLVKEGNGRLAFRLEDSGDTDSRARTGNNGFPADEWHHIAVTWDLANDRTEIYLDGVLEDAATNNLNGVLGDLNTLYIGDNRSTGVGGNEYTGNSANGTIDEFRVHAVVLTSSQIIAEMNATHPCTLLARFEITVAASASTCVPHSVTIAAKDALDNVLTGYTGTVTLSTSTGHGTWAKSTSAPIPQGTLTAGSDNGAATYAFVAADNGSIVLTLDNQRAEDLTATVVDPAVPASSSTSAVVSFLDNTFVIAPTDVLGTSVVAGRNHAMKAELWRCTRVDPTTCNTCSIADAYTGTRDLDAWYTAQADHPAGASAPVIDGVTLPGSAPAINPASNNLTTLNFASGVANFNLSTSDVGKYALNLRDDTGSFASAVNISGASGILTVRPFALHIDVPGNTGNNLPTGAIVAAAGADFTATVRGVLWQSGDDSDSDGVPDSGADLSDNGVTPRFAWATVLSPVTPFTPATPADTPAGTGTPGTLARGAGGNTIAQADYSGGSATATDWRYSEVGSFSIRGTVTNFLNSGINLQTDNGVVGRFVPHHFNVVKIDGCAGGATFTYSGQPFTVIVTAKNAQDGTTQNYHGALGFSKAVTLSDAGDVTNFANNSIAAADFAGGIRNQLDVTYTFPAASKETVPAMLTLRATEDAGGDDVSSAPDGAEDTAEIRSGRLRIINAYGSELVFLSLPLRVEYFSSDGWVTSITDTCTALALGQVDLQNDIDDPAQGVATININDGPPVKISTVVPLTPAAGEGSLDFSAPGAGGFGYADARIDLGGNSWLKFDWDGDSTEDDPAGRATFGLYRGSPRHIYLRERY